MACSADSFGGLDDLEMLAVHIQRRCVRLCRSVGERTWRLVEDVQAEIPSADMLEGGFQPIGHKLDLGGPHDRRLIELVDRLVDLQTAVPPRLDVAHPLHVVAERQHDEQVVARQKREHRGAADRPRPAAGVLDEAPRRTLPASQPVALHQRIEAARHEVPDVTPQDVADRVAALQGSLACVVEPDDAPYRAPVPKGAEYRASGADATPAGDLAMRAAPSPGQPSARRESHRKSRRAEPSPGWPLRRFSRSEGTGPRSRRGSVRRPSGSDRWYSCAGGLG